MGMKWKCADGRIIEIEKMEIDHAKNCLSLLRKKGFVSIDEFWGSCQCASSCGGDMASYYAEQEIAAMRPHPVVDAFEKRISRG